jgi:hypothetical protein
MNISFRLALRAKVAEHCVLSRALDLEDQLRKTEEVDMPVGSDTMRERQADASPSGEAEPAGAEEDGEIADAAEDTMQQPQAIPRRPAAPLRKFMTMDGGLLLLPRSALPEVAEPSLAIEQEPVVFVRIDASRSWESESIKHSAWNVQLKPEHLECVYGSPEEGSMVFLAPWGARAQVTEVDPGDEAELQGLEGADNLKSLKVQLSERFELETGIEKERFLADSWISVRESLSDHLPSQHISADSREMLWPRSLCFPLAKESSGALGQSSRRRTLGKVSSEQTKTKVCHTPISDLLRATAKMLEEQHKERIIPMINNEDDRKEIATEQDLPDALMQEVSPPVSRPSVVVGETKTDLGSLDEGQEQHVSLLRKEADVAQDDADENDDDLFGSEGDDSGTPLEPAAGSADLPGLYKGSEPEVDTEKGPQSQYPRFNDPQDGLYGMDMITEDDFAFFDDDDDVGAGADADILPISDTNVVDMIRDVTDIAAEEMEQPEPQPSNVQHEAVMAYTEGNGIASDPSSMPGFTPSSFTDSSPATGHPMDRTPRTPTSPYYEVGSIVAGGSGRIPTGMYPENIHEAWQGTELAAMRGSEASPVFEDTMGQRENGSDADHPNGHPSAVTLPSHKRLRDLGDKYTSGKFAVPQSFAAAIAGGRRARDAHHRAGATLALERNADPQYDAKQQQPEHHLGGLPALHKLRLMSRVEDTSSEAGTMDGTASNMSDDEDDEDDDNLSDLDEEEREIAALRMSRLQHLADLASSSLSRVDQWILRTSVVGGSEADAPETHNVPKVQEDEVYCDLRDEWITDLIWNPHLLAYLRPETQTRSTLSTLKAIDCRDVLDICSGLSASISSSDSHLQTERLESPRVLTGCQGSLTEFDATVLRFWDKLGLSGAGGSRDVSVFTLHSASKSEGWREEAHLWLDRLRHAFQSLGLGKCDVMDAVLLGSEDDDVETTMALSRELYSRSDLRDETLRSLFSRVKGRLGPDQHVVVYALGDGISVPDLINIKSMESDLRAIGREVVGDFANHIHVRYTPWSSAALKGWAPSSRISSSAIQRHAMALYDSLRVCFEHQPVRILHPTLARPKPVMMRLPSFLLVPPGESSRSAVSFAHGGVVESCSSEPMKSRAEATARILFLHAAYDLGSNVGDLACVSVIDESGQGGILKARRRGPDLRDTLRWIWRVVSDYAEQACVRWRIVICKTCTMSTPELAVWEYLRESGELENARCVFYTLASRDVKNPLLVRMSTAAEPLLPTTGGSSRLPAEGRFVDASQASFAIYPTCRVVPSPAPAQDLFELSDSAKPRHAKESLMLDTRSSAVVTTFRGPQDCRIPAADSSGKTLDRGEGSAEGTHTVWLHIHKVQAGRLFDWTTKSTESKAYFSEDFSSDHIRQVTRSLFGLRLLAQEPCALDPSGLSPWPFAAIDRVRPVLDKLALDGPGPDKKAPPPISRLQSYASTSTQTVHKEEVMG